VLTCFLGLNNSVFAQGKKYNQTSLEVTSGIQVPLMTKNISRKDYTSLNQFQISGRYMFNPKFGMKGNFGFHSFKNRKDKHKPQYDFYRYSLEAVVNLAQLFEIHYRIRERATILVHAGGGYTFVNGLSAFDKTDYSHLNIGFTGQIKLNNQFSLIGDISVIKNFPTKTVENNIEMYALVSLGLVYHLGRKTYPADWY